MIDQRKQVEDFAKSTLKALVGKWEEDGGKFVYDNENKKDGILSHAMGATSLLLLCDAFRDNEDFFSEISKQKVNDVIRTSLDTVFESIEKEGYSASPWAPEDQTKELFDLAQGRAYTDTVTWVVSACSLAHRVSRTYANRSPLFIFGEEADKRIGFYLAQALKIAVDSQREDGTWGFLTTVNAKNSLYFTYAMAVSFGDFFDYVLDEICEIDGREKEQDEEFIRIIKAHNGEDFIEKVENARTKLSNWLIMNALPRLPKIAAGEPCSSEDRAILGIGSQSYPEGDKFVNYVNLYYTYQIIDMLVTSNADGYYAAILNDARVREENGAFSGLLLNEMDRSYYFNNGVKTEAADNLVKDYIEESLHSSRSCLSRATRTGAKFWDSKKSELKISWEYSGTANDKLFDITETLDAQYADGRIKDPSLAPMALRANAQYVYYITQRSDQNLEKLFEIIVGDVYDENTDGVKSRREQNLWDKLYYSLSITERSIEALVDYYDYIKKYEKGGTCERGDASKSEIDSAIEKKIAAYLKENKQEEDSVVALIDRRITEKLSALSLKKEREASEAKDKASNTSITKELTNIIRRAGQIITKALPSELKGQNNEDVNFIKEVETLYCELKNYILRGKIEKALLDKEGKSPDKEEVREKGKQLNNQIGVIENKVITNVDENKTSIQALFNALIRLASLK